MEAILKKIREAKDTRTKTIHVKEWDVDLLLIEPSIKVSLEFQEKYLNIDQDGTPQRGSDIQGFNWSLLSECVHTLDGKRLFPDMDAARTILEPKSSLVIGELIKECGELISPPKQEEVEKAEKNSEGTLA